MSAKVGMFTITAHDARVVTLKAQSMPKQAQPLAKARWPLRRGRQARELITSLEFD
jgi:hypothetical protein